MRRAERPASLEPARAPVHLSAEARVEFADRPRLAVEAVRWRRADGPVALDTGASPLCGKESAERFAASFCVFTKKVLQVLTSWQSVCTLKTDISLHLC